MNKYQDILSVVEEEIGLVLEKIAEGIELQEPINSKLFTFLNSPSKHIRPLVSFLYLKAIGVKIDKSQILCQTAVEIVHNASLIHDDVIDESIERRGISTLNVDLGNKLAVICGDYLLSMALEKILQIGNIELVQMFSDTLKVMSEGEILQQFDKFKIPTLKEYIEKTGKKTAKLFETALLGGLLIASKNLLPVYKEAYEFAHNFGIAFQIQNDLINCKTTKSDIKDGIYTAPVILSDNIENINSGIEKTQSLLNNYIDRAENALKNIEENIYLRGLIDLLELMKNG